MNLLEELQRTGWDPFDPSEECRKSTDLPSMPAWLTEIDRLGIYHNYLTLILYGRFARGTKDGDPRRRRLQNVAVLFALRRSNLAERLTPELATEWAHKIAKWREEVLGPADEQIQGVDPNVVVKNPQYYEPAFTLTWITVNMGIVDVDRDRELMSLGRAMHEENSNRPRRSVATSDEDLRGFHEFLTSGGNTIARISDEGKFEVDPLQVKKWLDSKLGRVLQAEGEAEVPIQLPDEDQEDLIEALDSVDLVDRVREARDSRRAEAEEGSPRWHVLQCFFELAQGDLSIRELAERVGHARTSLQDAFAAEKSAIARALRAA